MPDKTFIFLISTEDMVSNLKNNPSNFLPNPTLIMKPFLLALLIICVNDLFASKTMKRKREPIPPQWDTLFYKNELSLDVSPVIGFAIATYRSNESLALTYRRFLGKRDAIRIGTRHRFNS